MDEHTDVSETQSMARIYIKPTDRVFVLTGAGMSAESGIPTFRDTNCLLYTSRCV